MTALQLRIATTIAKSDLPLDDINTDAMFGCGCSDFKPVWVGIATVAKFLRWQCQLWSGGWDENQYNEDRPVLLRNVHISDAMPADVKEFLHNLYRSANDRPNENTRALVREIGS